MRELDETLDVNEFIEAANGLYNTLNIPDKSLILNYNKIKKPNRQLNKFRVSYFKIKM